MRKQKLLLPVFLLLALQAAAGGYQISAQSIKALGMGGSLSGRVFDAGTVYFNPGGMTALGSTTTINAGVSLLLPRTSFLGSQNQSEQDDSPFSIPFHIYAATKLKNEKLSVGLSINTPYGTTAQWNNDWTGRYIVQRFRINTLFIQPTAAYKINDNWSVGAGPVIANGNVLLQRALPYLNVAGNESTLELKGSGTALGANVGAYYTKNKLSVGITWRSAAKIRIKNGDATFEDLPSILVQNGSIPVNATFSSDLNIPGVITLAGGYQLNDKVIFTLGFNYTQWSVVESMKYDFDNPTLTDIRTDRKYRNVLTFRGGIEAKSFKNITLRGGLALDRSPVPADYFSPDIPDDDRIIVSGGFSWQMRKHLSIDAAFMFENVREHRESNNQQYGLNGTYNSFIYNAGIGAQYTF
jgi:long-chain fatty acid transport protein